jgi:hypothetical protein
MQVKLTQDYYGFIRQSLPRAGQEAPAQAPSPRPTVLPAERLVEGELLKNRSRQSSTLDDLLQRGRLADDTVPAAGRPAQRAIDTYLGYAGVSAGAAGGPRRIDYYA